MRLTKNKISYIIPGEPSTIDMRLSMYLESPILYTENAVSSSIFTKSGSRRVFEICELSTPIGEWSINNREDLFSKLSNLISNYPSINIWLFKIDDEFGGRGIGYIQLDKFKHIIQIKKERQNGNMTKEKFEMNVSSILKASLHKKVEIMSRFLFNSGEEFIDQLVSRGGIIEACPTFNLSGIVGSPAISFLIEPNGFIKNFYSYDKVPNKNLSTACYISPQNTITNLNTKLIVDKIGEYLYSQSIIGYITVEFICFSDGNKTLFWAIDLKNRLSDVHCQLEFSNKLNQLTKNNQNTANNCSNENLINTLQNKETLYVFSIPYLISRKISFLKMKSLINSFRSEHLIYDIDKSNGIIFSISDIIQSGIIGIFGISNNYRFCLQLLEDSVSTFKSLLPDNQENKEIQNELDIYDIISVIRLHIKQKMKIVNN